MQEIKSCDYKKLHHFWELHPPCQQTPGMCLTDGTNKVVLACGLPLASKNWYGRVDYKLLEISFRYGLRAFLILTLSPWEFCPAYVRLYTNMNFSIILNLGSPIVFLS